MFDLHNFILTTIKGMIRHYPDFQVREYALNWYSKGKLTEEDLNEIDVALTTPNEEEMSVQALDSEGFIDEEISPLEDSTELEPIPVIDPFAEDSSENEPVSEA